MGIEGRTDSWILVYALQHAGRLNNRRQGTPVKMELFGFEKAIFLKIPTQKFTVKFVCVFGFSSVKIYE